MTHDRNLLPPERDWFWIRVQPTGLHGWWATCGEGPGEFGEPGASGFRGRTREKAILKAVRFLSKMQVEGSRSTGVLKPIRLEAQDAGYTSRNQA